MNYRLYSIFVIISKASFFPRFCDYGRKGNLKGTLAIAFIAILCLSIFSAYAPKVNAQQSSADWPMFRNDSAHTGATTNIGPEQPVKL